jgi:lysozyme family protein
MTPITDEQILDDVLAREGGFSNRADDPGGATSYGITRQRLSEWRGREVTVDEVQSLTVEEARAIYRHCYIQAPGLGGVLDDELRALLVDCAVLHGPRNAVRFLQRAIGATDDGVFGDLTKAALWRLDRKRLLWRVFAERVMFLGRIITDNLTDADRDGIPDNTEFAKGWLARVGAMMMEAA